MIKKIPIGIDDFSKLVEKNRDFLFVDKTLLIKDLIDKGSEVSLIIRPRRWGKTLNMSMLRCFFASEINGTSTKEIFKTLKIAKIENGKYLDFQGQYPVIFITLKEVKEHNYDEFMNKMYFLVQQLCNSFPELENSKKLSDIDKNNLERLKGLNKQNKANNIEIRDSLNTLSGLLYKHHNKKVVILIDEYDTPLNYAYNKDHFEPVVNFLKGMFGSALKGNYALEKGVITGILRLSKNKMLSDINNLKIYSFMEEQYSQYFGFSEQELKALLIEMDLNIDLKELQYWYNGYRSGKFTALYNPWSILNCIEDRGTLKPYWIKTGDETLLKDIFSKAPKNIENKLIQLLEGGSIESTIDEYVSFDQVNHGGGEEVLWSLLWATGYLKFSEQPTLSEMGNYLGSLAIPNYEVSCSYRAVFPKWIRSFNRVKYDAFLNNLVLGKVDAFVKDLEDYLLTVPSYFDFPRESNYHTFLLGLTASLQETHQIHSNKEAGFGRLDLLLIPKNTSNHLGIILEFKREEPGNDLHSYYQIAAEGLEQIEIKQYASALKTTPSITQVLKLCIVFYGKQFAHKFSIDQLK